VKSDGKEKEKKGRERGLSGEELVKRIAKEKYLCCIWKLKLK